MEPNEFIIFVLGELLKNIADLNVSLLKGKLLRLHSQIKLRLLFLFKQPLERNILKYLHCSILVLSSNLSADKRHV